MKITVILALDSERGIGKNGKLPWHCPGDLAHFKATTLGSPIIMGRKTFASIGRALPHRVNIILSKNMPPTEGVYIRKSIEESLEFLRNEHVEEAFVIGGAEVYRSFFESKIVDEILVSVIPGTHEADVFAPEFPAEFHRVSREEKEGFTVERWAK